MSPADITRRSFLKFGFGALAATATLATVPALEFMSRPNRAKMARAKGASRAELDFWRTRKGETLHDHWYYDSFSFASGGNFRTMFPHA